MLRCRQANHKLRLQGQGRQNRQPRQVLFLVAMRRTVNTSNFGPEVVNVKVKVDEKNGGLVVLDGYLQYLTNSNVDLCRGRLCLRSAVHPRSRLSRADGCQMVVGRQRALWRHLFSVLFLVWSCLAVHKIKCRAVPVRARASGRNL